MSRRRSRQDLEQTRRTYAGCVLLAYDRRTGALRGVYRAEEQGLDDAGWATVCEDHGTLVISETRKLAEASHTNDFCEDCRRAS